MIPGKVGVTAVLGALLDEASSVVNSNTLPVHHFSFTDDMVPNAPLWLKVTTGRLQLGQALVVEGQYGEIISVIIPLAHILRQEHWVNLPNSVRTPKEVSLRIYIVPRDEIKGRVPLPLELLNVELDTVSGNHICAIGSNK